MIFGGGLLVMFSTALIGHLSGLQYLAIGAAIGYGIVGIMLGVLSGDVGVAKWCWLFWIVQIPFSDTEHFVYKIYCGGNVVLAAELDNPTLNMSGQLGSAVLVGFHGTSVHPHIALNCFAIIAALYFWRLYRAPFGRLIGSPL